MTEQQLLFTEEKLITPLNTVLHSTLSSPRPHSEKMDTQALKASLDVLFPEQKCEEKRVRKAKEILGSIGTGMSDTQLKDTITGMQCLADSWLDDFERNIFTGMTLQEILHEKGNV